MSKIEELLAEFCPDGVEYKRINELGFLYGGLSGKSKTDFEKGNAKYITYKNIYANISVDVKAENFVSISENEKQNKIEVGDVLFTGSSENKEECGMSSEVTELTNEDLYLNSFSFGFRLDDKSLFISGFLKYLFRDSKIREQIIKTASGVTRMNVSKKRFEKISIPIPPLPVQEEIVKILDKFTQLEAELEAELEARTRQYEYYRNQLLAFEGKEVEWRKIGEVGEIKRGVAFTKKQAVAGKYPVIANASNPISYHNEANRNGECIVIARSGANAGLVSYWNEELFLTDAFSIHPNNTFLNTKFIYYYLKNLQRELHLMKKGSGVPHVRASDFEIYSVPVPSLEEQERTVKTLDQFDALVNDISVGLPAEIKARREQYEYYRGKLLSFEKINP